MTDTQINTANSMSIIIAILFLLLFFIVIDKFSFLTFLVLLALFSFPFDVLDLMPPSPSHIALRGQSWVHCSIYNKNNDFPLADFNSIWFGVFVLKKLYTLPSSSLQLLFCIIIRVEHTLNNSYRLWTLSSLYYYAFFPMPHLISPFPLVKMDWQKSVVVLMHNSTIPNTHT